jgi:hypothetical protein
MTRFPRLKDRVNLRILKRHYHYFCATKDNSSDKGDIEERKLLFGAMLDGSKLFDKAIITISAGAYGLSLTMLSALQPIKPGTLSYLKYAWILLGACIVLTLISLMTSQQACMRNIKIIQNRSSENNHNETNIWSIITYAINFTTTIIFIIGLFLLTNFGFLNVSQKEDKVMSDKKVEKPEQMREGFVPPTPPKKPNEVEKGFVPPPPPPKKPPKPPKE